MAIDGVVVILMPTMPLVIRRSFIAWVKVDTVVGHCLSCMGKGVWWLCGKSRARRRHNKTKWFRSALVETGKQVYTFESGVESFGDFQGLVVDVTVPDRTDQRKLFRETTCSRGLMLHSTAGSRPAPSMLGCSRIGRRA